MAESLDFYVNVLSGSSSGLAAVSALKSLDDAAERASGKIEALEGKLEDARAALQKIGDSGPDFDAMTSRLDDAKKRLDAIKSGKVPFDPKEYRQASDEVGKLGSQLETAKTKQAAAIGAQQSKIDGLTKALTNERSAQASSAALNAAKRAQAVKGVEEQVSKVGSLAEAAKEAGGPIGSIVGKLQGLAKAGPAAAIIALVVAFVALAAAAAVAAAALARYVLVAADAARSSALLSAAATGSGSAGWELERVVSQLSDKIPQAREKTAEWARELALAGLRGRDMQRTLTAMGMVAAAVGDQSASKIRGIAEASRMAQRFLLGARDRFGEFASLQGTGIKAADIYAAVAKSMRVSIPEAARMVQAGIVPLKKGLEALELAAETKFGGIVARQMMSLKTQGEKLKENLLGLFSGVNIETFLKGLKEITDLFSESSVLGYSLRKVFGEFFTSISDGSSKVFPFLKAAVYGVAFGVILLMTWAVKLGRALKEGIGDKLSGVATLENAFALGAAAVGGLVAALLFVPLVLAAIATAALVMTAPLWLPFVLAAVAIYGMVKAFDAIKAKLSGLVDSLKGIDLKEAGANIIQGLIDGIASKVGAATDAIKSVATAITGAFTGEMKIQSPSKKAMGWGGDIAKGTAIGIERETPRVEMASLAMAPSAPRSGDTGSAASREPVNITINVTGRDDGDEVARKVREELQAFFMGEARGFALAAP